VIGQQKPKKRQMKHLYFVQEEGGSVVRVITDAPETFLMVRGYRRVSYNQYLRVRRSMRHRWEKELQPCRTQ
jgi:hypothetical protein